MHYLDKASPVLLQRCATGEHIKEATITVRKAGKKEPLEYLIIKLTDILVSNVSSSGAGDASTSESVTLNYSKIELEYKPQKADGSLDAGRISSTTSRRTKHTSRQRVARTSFVW